jgi:hypothetical protein
MTTTIGSGTTPLYAVFRVAVGSPRLPTIQAAINTFRFPRKSLRFHYVTQVSYTGPQSGVETVAALKLALRDP